MRKNNDYLDFRAAQKRKSFRKRRRVHPFLPLLVLGVLIMAIIIGAGFLLKNAKEETAPEQPEMQEQMIEEVPDDNAEQEEQRNVLQGPFGLWEWDISPDSEGPALEE